MVTVEAMCITVLCTIFGSAGFWMVIQKFMEKRSASSKMILGLGHDRIIFLGMSYIDRGYITQDEYENLIDYLWSPYEQMGGNGSAKRVMDEVRKLEIRKFRKEVINVDK